MNAPISDLKGAPRRRVDVLLALGIGLGAFVLLLATSPQFGMVWDEGWALDARDKLSEWFSWVLTSEGHPPRSEAFSRANLERSWPFSKELPNTHPPGHVLLILLGWWPSREILPPLESARLGPIALNSLGVAAVFFHLAGRLGRLAGLAGASALILMPRSFALAHYAHCDMPLSVLWLMTQMAFLKALGSGRWIVPYGVLFGLAIVTKFTGVFAVVPPLLWVVGYEWIPRIRWVPGGSSGSSPRPSGLRGTTTIVVGSLIAALVVFGLQPPWWADPVRGVTRFLTATLTRENVLPLPTYYLGETYDFALPWHNSIVLTVVTTPFLILALGLLGAGSSLGSWKTQPWSVLWVLSWITLLVVRALPNAPGHDGIRLFLPSFASLAVLAGIGVGRIAARFREGNKRLIAPILTAAMIGEASVGVIQTYPYTDSYYSGVVGGLPGAERMGFELTYFWETLGPEFRGWLREQSRRGPVELRFQTRPVVVDFARKWGEWPANVHVDGIEPTRAPFYVLPRRKSIYNATDRALDRDAPAVFSITRQGIDLLRVYSFETAVSAYLKNNPYGPSH